MAPTVAVRIAYDGTCFSGSQRQPQVRTVEGAFLAACERAGIELVAFRAASRTDAGVSAVGNVFTFETDFHLDGLAPSVNARLEDAWCWAVAPAPPDLSPRHASTSRSYRYVLPRREGVDVKAFDAALALFEGEHDLSAFARVIEGKSPRRRVDHVAVEVHPRHLVVDVTGPSFLWNQVRRMVAAAEAHAVGNVTLATIREALAMGQGPDLGLAAAEGLVLLDVALDVDWVEDHRLMAWVERRLAERADRLGQRWRVQEEMRARFS